MTLSKLFLAAIKYLPKEEFLCHAINEASLAALRKAEKANKGEDEIDRLIDLRYTAKSIVMAQLDGYLTLNSWMMKQLGKEYHETSEEVIAKKMLDARKRWARSLAEQYKVK